MAVRLRAVGWGGFAAEEVPSGGCPEQGVLRGRC